MVFSGFCHQNRFRPERWSIITPVSALPPSLIFPKPCDRDQATIMDNRDTYANWLLPYTTVFKSPTSYSIIKQYSKGAFEKRT